MRLIKADTLELEEFPPDQLPPYAILSHTWGKDNNEVTFEDVVNQRDYHQKPGRLKLLGACRVTQSIGLSHVWVDTCCIDKTSSAELSEAINSMFSWYRSSAVCLAYLDDLPPSTDQGDSDEFDEPTWRNSRWWTRGWTLQELLAPSQLQFYDRDWNLRGNKAEHPVLGLISRITHIDEDILLDSDLIPDVSIAERMSWAARRATTRIEDMAYCLMGIFDVNMPVLYGEGRKAFRRLQEEILRSVQDLSIFAWASASRGGPLFSGILADSPRDFRHNPTRYRWRVPVPFNGEISLTNRGLSMLANFISFGQDFILDLGNLGGGAEKHGVLLREVNGVLVRLSPNLLFVAGSTGAVGQGTGPAGCEDQRVKDQRYSKVSPASPTRLRSFAVNERTVSRKAIVKTVLDRRLAQFLERKFAKRCTQSGPLRPGTYVSTQSPRPCPRPGIHQQSVSAPRSPSSLESWSHSQGPDVYVGSSAAASFRTIPHREQRTVTRPESSNSSSTTMTEGWVYVSPPVSSTTKGTPRAAQHQRDETDDDIDPESDDDLSVFEDIPTTVHVLEPGNPFLGVKDDLVQVARKTFEMQLGEDSRQLFAWDKDLIQENQPPFPGGSPGAMDDSDDIPTDMATADEVRHCQGGGTHLPLAEPRLLACPFWKQDPIPHHKCLVTGEFRHIRELLQHLWAQHRQPAYCPICYETFAQVSAWSDHIIRRTCTPVPRRTVKGLTEEQMHLLAKRTRRNGDVEGSWFAIWDVAFPGSARPGSPFVGGDVERVIGLARRFWEKEGRRVVSDFSEKRGLLTWETADEERGLEALHAIVLVEVIDLLVGKIDDKNTMQHDKPAVVDYALADVQGIYPFSGTSSSL